MAVRREEMAMHSQMVSFLQTAVVFLLVTNTITALIALYAMKAAEIRTQPVRRGALERKLQDMLRRS
jgi:hypothetical protein